MSPLCSSEDKTAPESTEDPVIIRDGSSYNESGRQFLSAAVVSNDTACHFSLPSTADCDFRIDAWFNPTSTSWF